MAFHISERSFWDADYPYWYDFDTAVTYDQGYLNLYEPGCQVGENKWNCTAACLDTNVGPNQTWNATNGMFTLHNCVVLPVIASLLASGKIAKTSLNLTTKYNIVPSTNLTSRPNEAWPVIRNCISDYCAANSETVPGCKSNPNSVTQLVWAPNRTAYENNIGNWETFSGRVEYLVKGVSFVSASTSGWD